MAKTDTGRLEVIMVDQSWWELLQATLEQAVALHNDIASQIEAHQRYGLHNAEELLDRINGEVREARKLLELIEVPF